MSVLLSAAIEALLGIDDVHKESCDKFDDYKLKNILFAAIGEVFCFFPMS
jgi:hypothetical protein